MILLPKIEKFKIEQNYSEVWSNAYSTIIGNFSEALNEFLDNSISNLLKNKINNKTIKVKLYDLKDRYTLQVRDNGTGINREDIGRIFGYGLGDRTNKDSTMNDHGCGMKQALAALDKKNNNWVFITKYDDGKKNPYTIVKNPYSNEMEDIQEDKLPDYILKNDDDFDHGTLIQVNVTKSMLLSAMSSNTRKDYLRERKKKDENDEYGVIGDSFEGLCNDIKQDISYVYGPILSENDISVKFQTNRNHLKESNCTIDKGLDIPFTDVLNANIDEKYINEDDDCKFVYCRWADDDSIELVESEDKSESEFRIYFKYYMIEPKNETYNKYYLANETTSGVEIRFNGRVMVDNLLEDIYSVKSHNSYNRMLIQIDIVTDDITKLPSTRVNKNDILEDDGKFIGVKKFVANNFSKELVSDKKYDEKKLVRKLFENRKKRSKKDPSFFYSDNNDVEKVIGGEKKGDPNFPCDLYEEYEDRVCIYEFKTSKLKGKDLYQLLMYIDTLILYDEKNLLSNKMIYGKLIGKTTSEDVEKLIKNMNKICGYESGERRKIIFSQSTWDGEFGSEMLPLKEDRGFPKALLNGYKRSK